LHRPGTGIPAVVGAHTDAVVTAKVLFMVASLLLQASPLHLASLPEDDFPNVDGYLDFVGVPAIVGAHTVVAGAPAVVSSPFVAGIACLLLMA
jgi:hypothetical protein